MHFAHITTVRNKTDLNTGYKDKIISNIFCTIFFGVILDSTLTWSNHIELLTKKLSTTCYVIRTIKPYLCLSQH